MITMIGNSDKAFEVIRLENHLICLDDSEVIELLKKFRVMLARNGVLIVSEKVSNKDDLGFQIYRNKMQYQDLFESAFFEVNEIRTYKVSEDDVMSWRLI